jgi:hypothetical protein
VTKPDLTVVWGGCEVRPILSASEFAGHPPFCSGWRRAGTRDEPRAIADGALTSCMMHCNNLAEMQCVLCESMRSLRFKPNNNSEVP